MAKQPLVEIIPFELKEAREVEHNGEHLMQITGIMHRANELTGSHRIYPTPILFREVNKLKERLSSGDTVFSQGHRPGDGCSRSPDTIAVLQKVEYTPADEVIGTAVILPTREDRDLAAIVRAGGKVSVTVHGFGNTRFGEYAGQKGEVVQKDYELVTYDFRIGHSPRQYQVPQPVVASTGRRLTVKQRLFAEFLLGAANGNATLAARMAGYRGDDRQLAVQAHVNRRHVVIQQIINERLAALAEPSLKRLEEGLDATKRRAFMTKTNELVYTDFEPDHRVRTNTANRILDRLERTFSPQPTDPHATDTNQENDGSVQPQQKVDDLDSTDRSLLRQTSEIDARVAEIDRQLAKDENGTERKSES